MTTVNQSVRIESSVPPAEILAFRQQYPYILETLVANQILISKLITRVGGSGSGTAAPNLDEVYQTVDSFAVARTLDSKTSALSEKINDIYPAELILSQVRKAIAIANEAVEIARDAEAKSKQRPVTQEVARDDYLNAAIGSLSSRISRLEHQFVEVEAVCQSNLAR